ncbi:bifunctional diguanylate cyclase/phosphodiesterase [Sphingomonas sp. M1-B02]|uniref:bifunctional diguanylate cyclase/phosphodiesterase n=1 Tax=Sphingomonas sp. M1-B02 TaxID=3114300 RepID=UPI002240599C|nr:EAL domain-containing protein [Sphingomonas sp. S6-11]UZK66700.1 EAL domain-containing protein [Sphingomonas sp. S6-11]
MLPLVVLEGAGARQERLEERAEIATVALRTAHRAAAEQERIVMGARQLLTALSQIPAIQQGEVARCNLILSRIQRQFEMYQAIGVADTSGRIWCSSARAGTDISDRAYFQRALATRDFGTGGYVIGRLMGRPSLNFNLAVLDARGGVTGVLVAGLDLSKLAKSLQRAGLPPATRLAIAGPDRRILVSLPDGTGVGQNLPAHLQGAFTSHSAGTLESRWLDGSDRVIAYVPPQSETAMPFMVAVGTDRVTALEGVERRAWLRMLLLVATVMVALLLTCWFAVRSVSRPMQRLTKAVLAWQRGERDARVGAIGDGAEFDALANVYDELADGYAERHRRLYDALEGTSDSVITVSPDWTINFLNDRARGRLKSYDACGRNFWATFPGIEHGWVGDMFREAMDQRRPLSFSLEYAPLEGHFLINALPLESGEIMLFIRDVTEQHRSQEELRKLALSDALTGLPNRASAMNMARMKLAEDRLAALLLIDLDGFKDVNDSFGHPAGDALLQQVAERLRQCCGGSNVIARLGGDEFIALVDRDHAGGDLPAQLLKALTDRPFYTGNRSMRVQGSCGAIIVPERTQGTVEELLANADLALYRAKTEGGGRVHLHTSADREAYEKRRLLEDEVERAALNGEFELFYQPQVRLCDSALIGAEALLRWRHPERGLLSPCDFIAVLSASRQASVVGAWVLEEACRQASIWWRTGNRLRVAVNLFPDQVKGHDLAGMVRDTLSRHCLPPQALEIEVTEAVALSEAQGTRDNLLKLRMLGVWLSLDDFGTGFASLTTLKELQVDRLKIDRSFVAQLPYNNQDLAIVEAVLALARTLNLGVIAEGVENEAQEIYLRARGCQEAQGFRYGAPMTAAHIDRLVAAGDGRAIGGDNTVPRKSLAIFEV